MQEEAKTARLDARLPESVLDLLRRAASLQRRTLSDFVVCAAREAAALGVIHNCCPDRDELNWQRFVRECDFNESLDLLGAVFPDEGGETAKSGGIEPIVIGSGEAAEINRVLLFPIALTMR